MLLLASLLIASPLLTLSLSTQAEEGKSIRESDPRPNVVLIVADDVGCGDVGFSGGTEPATPSIDSIATGGVRFATGYVTCPVCAPSRAALLTGRYPQRFGFEFNQGPGHLAAANFGLPLTVPTLAERLRTAGYATGAFGKWHLGQQDGQLPTARGFDQFFGFLENSHPYRAKQRGQPNEVLRGTAVVEEAEHLTAALAREACEFITASRERPFFLYVPFSAAHRPIQPDPRTLERFTAIENPAQRSFVALVSELDDAVGRILARLRDCRLDQRTLVCFLSDNGSQDGSNGALRGSKSKVYEGGIRVPFALRWPGRVAPGSVFVPPVSSLDATATILAAANAATTPDLELDGRDLLPFLEGKASGSPHDALFWRFGSVWAVRQGDWKLVQQRRNSRLELFNLAVDPGEQSDLAATEPVQLQQLQATYDAWNVRNATPLWDGLDEWERRLAEEDAGGDGR